MQGAGPTSWNNLYRELLSFVNLRVRDRSDAEDIVQDVFVKVHTKLYQVKESTKLTSWIFQITRNTMADHFRKRSKEVEQGNVNWESSEHEFNECVATCLRTLMDALPEKYRLPLQLAEIENLSQYEIAETLNISYAGARSRVQRARKLLKQRLNDLYHIKTDPYGNVIVCEDRTPCHCKHP